MEGTEKGRTKGKGSLYRKRSHKPRAHGSSEQPQKMWVIRDSRGTDTHGRGFYNEVEEHQKNQPKGKEEMEGEKGTNSSFRGM